MGEGFDLLAKDACLKWCYVAGRIRNNLNYHREFAEAADKLRKQGWLVFNPAGAGLEGMPLHKIMAYVLWQLTECDAIALMPGWWRSGGARIEWMLARYLGMKRIYL